MSPTRRVRVSPSNFKSTTPGSEDLHIPSGSAAEDVGTDLYALGVSLYELFAGDSEAVFTTVEHARHQLETWRSDPQKSILLTRDIATMMRLAAGGLLRGTSVNLGGIHHGPDRVEVLTYLHLTPEDRDDLSALSAGGVKISARDLPDAHKVSLEALVG